MGMDFWGKSWDDVLLDLTAKRPDPAGQQCSPHQPGAVMIPGVLPPPSAEAEAGQESAPLILGY